MSRLSDIPVRIEHPGTATPPAAASSPQPGTIGGSAGIAAILMELATALERLAAGADPTAIDLRSLPMSDAEREQLHAALGPGEVSIQLEADGLSTIRETGLHGVWWAEYRDRDGQLLTAFIEVARVPGILVVDGEELREVAERLRRRLDPAHAN